MGVLAGIFGFVEPNQVQQITPALLRLVRSRLSQMARREPPSTGIIAPVM
jgi:hypothetical protein